MNDLQELKDMLDQGLITEDEYAAAREKIVSGLTAPAEEPAPTDKNKIAAALLAFFLGCFGAHKFYLGHTKEGVIMLLITLFGSLLLFVGPLVTGVIALVEAIMYITKSDREFYDTYVAGGKAWF